MRDRAGGGDSVGEEENGGECEKHLENNNRLNQVKLVLHVRTQRRRIKEERVTYVGTARFGNEAQRSIRDCKAQHEKKFPIGNLRAMSFTSKLPQGILPSKEASGMAIYEKGG